MALVTPTIGGIQCTFLHERAWQPLKQTVEIWHVPGHDGFGGQILGKGDSPCQYEAKKLDSDANCESWATSIYALQGTVVTVINEWGNQRDNVLVVSARFQAKVADPVNGGCRYEILINGLTLQEQA